MARVQTQGVHHITLVGSNRQATIDFYTGVLGMPFVFEQPNLDVPDETHLYFDPAMAGCSPSCAQRARTTRRPTRRASAMCITSPSSCRGRPSRRRRRGCKRSASPTPDRSIAASWT